MELLRLESVSKAFGGLLAVNRVSLRVADGEILGLIGPNGAGKTTLFNVIAGLYPAGGGRVLLRGSDITQLPAHRRCRQGIARTFQLVRPFPDLTVLDNVALGRLYGRGAVRDRRLAEEQALGMLETVGLAGRHGLPAKRLTLVDRKRLELARALAAEPILLLLDEFLAGLTPTEVLAALDLIRKLRMDGITIIMVEHVVKAIFAISDRVVVMNAGQVIADETPARVLADRRVIDVYLGSLDGA